MGARSRRRHWSRTASECSALSWTAVPTGQLLIALSNLSQRARERDVARTQHGATESLPSSSLQEIPMMCRFTELILALSVAVAAGCGSSLQVRHEFLPLHVELQDGTRVSLYAHGSWSEHRAADSSYSLRGAPYTLELQIRGAPRDVAIGALLSLSDSAGTEVARIERWTIVQPSGRDGYSILKVEVPVDLPYETVVASTTITIGKRGAAARSVEARGQLVYRFRTASPNRFLEALRGV